MCFIAIDVLGGLQLPAYFVDVCAVNLHTVGSGEHTVQSRVEPPAAVQSAFKEDFTLFFPPFFVPMLFKRVKPPG